MHNLIYKPEHVNTKTSAHPGKAAHRRIGPPGPVGSESANNPYMIGVGNGRSQEDEVEGDDEYGVKGQGNLNSVAEVGLQEE